MRRLMTLANFALLLLVLIVSSACGSAGGYGPSTGSSSAPSSVSPASEAPARSDAPASEPPATSPNPPGQAPAAPTPAPSTYQSPLTAGQVDDNALFNDYLGYLGSYTGPAAHRIDVQRRVFVRVLDPTRHPVAGARVQLFDGDRQVFDGRTVSDGRVLFFPNAAGAAQTQRFRAVITRGSVRYETNAITGQDGMSDVMLDGAAAGQLDNTGPVGIDLVFLMDATGSMGDEIDRIKETVDSIAKRIEQLPGSSKPRLALVAYRDRGDEYVTRSWDFTDNGGQFSANLAQVVANGGGDMAESVSAGLHEAIHLQGWADNSHGRHLRLIALVGDAPPHLDYPNDYEYTALLNEAVASGIKIFPIGASGLNDQGEYIFRQLAEVTQGQFVFLTYANGVSGAPGSATTDHVSNFTVKNLDSLVVSLVAGEVANQTSEAGQGGNSVSVAGSVVPAEPAPPPSRSAGAGNTIAAVALSVLWLPLYAWSVAQSVLDQVSNAGMMLLLFLLLLAAFIILPRLNPQRARIAPARQQPALPSPETGRIAPHGVPTRVTGEQHPAARWTSTPASHATIEYAAGQQTMPLRSLPPEIATALKR